MAAELGLEGTCDCFDLTNACAGFLTAFDIGARHVATGGGAVGIAVAEMASRYLTPTDPRPFLVFGDAAAAVVLDAPRGGGGVVASSLRNDGRFQGWVMLGHQRLTGVEEMLRFGNPNAEMESLAVELVEERVAEVLDASGLDLADVDWLLPHQPNGPLLRALVDALGVRSDRVIPVVQEVGSVGAASIPISLDRLRHGGRLRPGQLVLMVTVAAGLASGAALLRVDR